MCLLVVYDWLSTTGCLRLVFYWLSTTGYLLVVYDRLSACRSFVEEGAKSSGRTKKTWEECVVGQDLHLLKLRREWPLDGTVWRGLKKETCLPQASVQKFTLKQ